MDKFNIIEPKTSLVELDMEMNQWLQLPTDFKFRSNDDCLRLHGCTVPDYYNRLKLTLMNAEDNAQSFGEPSNTVKEAIDFYSQGFLEKMKQTVQVMCNPYIVIVTPEDRNIDATYDNYLNLTSKNRRLSDYYSEQIWGVNVRNMYEILKSQENDLVPDETLGNTNLRLVDQMESVVWAIYDKWNKVCLEHNETEIHKINKQLQTFCCECAPYQKIAEEVVNSIIDTKDVEKMYLPRYCPWFTLEELADLGIESAIFENISNTEYKILVEDAYTKYNNDPSEDNCVDLLSLGWNPSVEPSDQAFKRAKERQYEYINQYFGHEGSPENHNDIRVRVDGDKISFAFPGNLQKLYTPWFNNKGTFLGYSQTPNIYTNKDMLVAKLDPTLYNNLEKKCKQMECPDKSEYNNYNNGLKQIIFDPVNKLDLDFERVKEACVVDTIYKLATMNLDELIPYPSISI